MGNIANSVPQLWLIALAYLAITTTTLAQQTEPVNAPEPIPTFFDFDTNPEAIQGEDLKPNSEHEGWFGWAFTLIYHVFAWFTEPVCIMLNAFLDKLGLPEGQFVVDFNLGYVGYYLGIADAWFPIHEMIHHTMVIVTILFLWGPIRLAIRYFVPGSGAKG